MGSSAGTNAFRLVEIVAPAADGICPGCAKVGGAGDTLSWDALPHWSTSFSTPSLRHLRHSASARGWVRARPWCASPVATERATNWGGLPRPSDTVCEPHKCLRSKGVVGNLRLGKPTKGAIKRAFFGEAWNRDSAGQPHSDSALGTVRALNMAELMYEWWNHDPHPYSGDSRNTPR